MVYVFIVLETSYELTLNPQGFWFLIGYNNKGEIIGRHSDYD